MNKGIALVTIVLGILASSGIASANGFDRGRDRDRNRVEVKIGRVDLAFGQPIACIPARPVVIERCAPVEVIHRDIRFDRRHDFHRR